MKRFNYPWLTQTDAASSAPFTIRRIRMWRQHATLTVSLSNAACSDDANPGPRPARLVVSGRDSRRWLHPHSLLCLRQCGRGFSQKASERNTTPPRGLNEARGEEEESSAEWSVSEWRTKKSAKEREVALSNVHFCPISPGVLRRRCRTARRMRRGRSKQPADS